MNITTAKAPAALRNAPLFVIGLIGLQLYTVWPINVAPLINGSLVSDGGFSESTVGILASIELLAYALTLILLAPLLVKLPVRRVGMAGLVLALIGNAAAAIIMEAVPLAIMRALAGMGGGLAVAAGASALATAVRVDRMAALLAVILSIVVAVATFGASAVSETTGATGLFLSCAVVAAIALGLVSLLPSIERVEPVRKTIAKPVASLRSPITLASMSIMFGVTAIWAFSERIGIAAGLTVSEVGTILAITALPGIIGGVAAYRFTKPGRLRGLAAIGTLMFGVSAVLLALSQTSTDYVVSMVLLSFFFVFLQPFLTSIAIAQDQSGGLAAAMAGWSLFASAAAPALAGLVLDRSGFGALAWIAFIATLVALLALFFVERNP